MKYFKIILASILIASICPGCSSEKNEQPPNILFILVDDMGEEVVQSYGGSTYSTPNIDALAETGTKFTNCYSAPVCSPSRVKLLTGRYGFRTGQDWGTIPEDEVTFGHILQDAGYKVAISGKWQMTLLKDDTNHIAKMGFPESCVFGWHEGPRYYEPLIYKNGSIRNDVKDKYGPDVFSDYIIDFIIDNKDKPFFAYYAMTLAHDISNDLPSPPPFGEKGRYETYKENIEYADKLVGKVVSALDELNLRKNTIIIFTADNGTPAKYITRYEDGKYIKEPIFSEFGDTLIQGGKSFLTDAGTHVPLIINWKGNTPAGVTNEDLIDFSDFMPTFAQLTGARLPVDRTIDGVSFAPQISGEKGEPRNWIYQLWEGEGWIRNAEWKLYFDGRLFNMKDDPYEQYPIEKEEDTPSSQEIRSFLARELTRLGAE